MSRLTATLSKNYILLLIVVFGGFLIFGIAGLQGGYIFIGSCALLCSAASLILYHMLKKRNALL